MLHPFLQLPCMFVVRHALSSVFAHFRGFIWRAFLIRLGGDRSLCVLVSLCGTASTIDMAPSFLLVRISIVIVCPSKHPFPMCGMSPAVSLPPPQRSMNFTLCFRLPLVLAFAFLAHFVLAFSFSTHRVSPAVSLRAGPLPPARRLARVLEGASHTGDTAEPGARAQTHPSGPIPQAVGPDV